ncbi:MAG TPA: adenylate/guanylate cyclase domain-containing protein [Acidimicrobiales bacterium]|nr:adenylate/guanylate cyclase domain-containing protein [Acidimicrobiales bacterium]
MSGAELERPPTDPPTEIPSDDDRGRVINLLRGAGSRLGLEEAERRMDAALRAPTKGELALLVWDLPDAARATPEDTTRPRVGAWRSFAFRIHGTVYGLVNGMLVGIWALTDSHDLFWPFFPIAGWGIGLAAHGVTTRAVQRHNYDQQVKRLERSARGELGRPSHPHPAPPHRHGRVPDGAAARTAKVAVMFTDVVDSTRLTMVIGDADWAKVRRRYLGLLRDCYTTTNGTEVSSQGDGFLARFDRPADAVRCAVAFQQKVQAQRDEVGFAPAVRIGVNAGDAIEERGDVLGTTVNLAARVTQAADPNEILVTEVVADALDGRFQLRDEGLREMKGLDRQVHVLSVAWK